jgi:hypothetical protein
MGPFKCPECGVWWAGFEHRCERPLTATGTNEPLVIRPASLPIGSGQTTSTPWCGICQGFHIPGRGPCNATWSAS